jgi:hypothetical protein
MSILRIFLITVFLSITANATDISTSFINPDIACAELRNESIATFDTKDPHNKKLDIDWERKRGLYLHDLQISTLEKNYELMEKSDVDAINDLIDADLYVIYAQTDSTSQHTSKSNNSNIDHVLTDLKSAQNYAVNTEYRPQIIEAIDLINTNYTSKSRFTAQTYKKLRGKISHIIYDGICDRG